MEKNKRDWKQVRNAFVMVCVAVAMLSTATYAWFTLTNQPSLTGMELTAGTTSGLQISLNDSDWNSTVALPTGEKTLVPVSPTESAVFGKPVYAANKVTGVETLSDTDATSKYLAKYKFYLKAVGDGTVNVCLLGGTGSDATGSFVKRNTAGSGILQAADTIRIGFKTTSDWKIFEPNANANNNGSGKKADTDMPEIKGNMRENTDGTFIETSSKTSGTVFTITGGNSLEIDMYVWIEGTDKDCVDEIQTDKLIGQLQFTVAE